MSLNNLERLKDLEHIFKGEYYQLAEKKYIDTSDNSEVLTIYSKAQAKNRTDFSLVFIPGWGTPILGWDEFLLEASKYFDLYYLETREMKSSILSKDSKYDIDRFSTDLQEVIENFGLDMNHTIVYGSSFGALVFAHALAKKKINPYLSFLSGPTGKIQMPPFIKYALHIFPPSFFNIFAPFGRWWIRKVKSSSPQQTERYLSIIDNADPPKWKKIGKHLSHNTFWDVYEDIDSRVIVIDESEDKLHESENTQRIANSIPNSKYIDLKTNDITHSKVAIDTIRKELSTLYKSNKLKGRNSL